MTSATGERAIVQTQGRLRSVGVLHVSGATGGFALDEVPAELSGLTQRTQLHGLVKKYYDAFVARQATGLELSGLLEERTSESAYYVSIFELRSETEGRSAVGIEFDAEGRSAVGIEFDDGADLGGLDAFAAEVASEHPSVRTTRPLVPELTGNLITDVRQLCGLTANDLATAFGRTERAILGWQRSGPPEEFEPPLRALEAVGLTLSGGLGPVGVRRWLHTGSPTRLSLIATGEIDAVVADLRRYEDFIAT